MSSVFDFFFDLVPLKLKWDGYSQEELDRRDQMRKLDIAVAFLFAAWYCLQGICICNPNAFSSFPIEGPGIVTIVMQVVLAAVAVYLLKVVHIFAFPAPTADSDQFKAQASMGKWIFLTRHCVTLQTWHQVFSIMGLFSGRLAVITHGMTPWIGTLGWFVTIQYFVLVSPSAAFKADCETWKKKGIQFKEVCELLHFPPLAIALLDVLLAKQRLLLISAVALDRTVLLILFYVVLYLGIIIANYDLTGYWPYGFLKDFGTSFSKWIPFILIQIVVLMLFFFCNTLIYMAKTA